MAPITTLAKTVKDWASPVLGVLGIGSSMATNRTNVRLARENRAWQERMSNTAAQRSVADYLAAGLNPALAYERSASTPGGETATVADAGAAGMNNWASARAAKDARQMMQAQVRNIAADIDLKDKQGKKTDMETDLTDQMMLESRARTAAIRADNVEKEANAEFWRALEGSGAGASAKGAGRFLMFLKNVLPQGRR